MDIAPTIIERAGLKPYFGIQGRSMLGNLDGSSNLRDALVIEHQDNMTRMGFSEPCMVRTLLVEGYRLTIYKGESWGELYDHAKDPDETHNRWDDAAYAGVRAKLIERLAQEMMANVDQSPRAPPARMRGELSSRPTPRPRPRRTTRACGARCLQ